MRVVEERQAEVPALQAACSMRSAGEGRGKRVTPARGGRCGMPAALRSAARRPPSSRPRRQAAGTGVGRKRQQAAERQCSVYRRRALHAARHPAKPLP